MADAVVMTGIGVALAQLISSQTIYLAVGAGLAEWDTANPIPQPTIARTGLYNEMARVVATCSYLTTSNQITGSPTARLQIAATFGVGVANGTIREMGVFLLGSGTLNSGTLIAGVHVGAISKPAGGGDYALARTMRLRLVE